MPGTAVLRALILGRVSKTVVLNFGRGPSAEYKKQLKAKGNLSAPLTLGARGRTQLDPCTALLCVTEHCHLTILEVSHLGLVYPKDNKKKGVVPLQWIISIWFYGTQVLAIAGNKVPNLRLLKRIITKKINWTKN